MRFDFRKDLEGRAPNMYNPRMYIVEIIWVGRINENINGKIDLAID